VSVSVLRELAPAKINLGLFVGPKRASDGRHELVSVMQSISLADELTLEPAGAAPGPERRVGGEREQADDRGERDEVLCPGVPGASADNLAARALRAFRAATGWDAPPQRLRIAKRIPLAAGLAGGSADAAAALRLAQRASGLGDERLLRELGGELGADVPAQIAPGRWLASGAGERLRELLPPRSRLAVLVLALDAELSTAAVYAQADTLALTRTARALRERGRALEAALAHGAPLPPDAELLHNDLQRAAASLCPPIAQALAQAREAGAQHALVSGSGPTVIGLFADAAGAADGDGALERARAAESLLAERTPPPVCAVSVQAAFARADDGSVRNNPGGFDD